MPISNSSVAAILRFVHAKGDTFIRRLTIENDEDPRQPVDLTGYTAIFDISTIKKAESLFNINSTENPDNINISGGSNNLINLSFLTGNIPAGRYEYTLSVVDPAQNIKTWLKGDFIIT